MDLGIKAESTEAGKSRIRQVAYGTAILSGCPSLIFSLISGANLALGIGFGVVVAVDGFLTWMIYHKASRRNDGLIIVISAAILTLNFRQRPDVFSLLSLITIHWIVNAPLAYLAGRYDSYRNESAQTSSDNSPIPSET